MNFFEYKNASIPKELSQFLNEATAAEDKKVESLIFDMTANILKKGFAIVKHNGDVTSNPDVFNPGSEMEVILLDKSIKSTVKSKSNHNGSEFNL